MTKVIFRKFKDNGDVIALFPQVAFNENYYNDCESYMRIGQHGPCSISNIASITSAASAQEYKSLFNELVSIGYDDLKIFKKINYADYKARKAAYHVN